MNETPGNTEEFVKSEQISKNVGQVVLPGGRTDNTTVNFNNIININYTSATDSRYEDEQDTGSPVTSVDEFLKLLARCENCQDNEEEELRSLDNISYDAWYLIIWQEDEYKKITAKIRDFHYNKENNLSKLLTPLYTILCKRKLVALEVDNFFKIGIINGIFLPVRHSMIGYSRLLRRLILHVLYSSPDILCGEEISEHLRELGSRNDSYWTEFFVDISLRYEAGNIQNLNPEFLKVLSTVCDRYKEDDNKPIVKLWPILTCPVETTNCQDKRDVLNIIRQSARTSKKNIEFKWCIATATRILPLYDCNGDEENNCEFITSLFEKEFDKNLVLKSPQLQFIYLVGLLKNFIRTKKIKYLTDYEKRFVKIYKILPHPSICHLQLEYVCCAYMYFQSTLTLDNLRIGVEIRENVNFLDKPLLNNRIIDYHKPQIYKNTNTIPRDNKIEIVEKFFKSYIRAMYDQYAKGQIQNDHLILRHFTGLCNTYFIRKEIGNATLRSLEDSIRSNNSCQYSFYAKSTTMFSLIKRHGNIDLIKKYIIGALKADKYSVIRHAKDIAWGLYSCFYYGEKDERSKIQNLSTSFALIADITNDNGSIKDQKSQVGAKFYWAYYAGIIWNKKSDEQEFIEHLYKVILPRETHQLTSNKDDLFRLEFPNEMSAVIENYSRRSIFAATLKMNLNITDVWNILGTTIYDNTPSDSLDFDKLSKAAHFYSIARCFAREEKDNIQKYCYNYIRCKGRVLKELSFTEESLFYVSDTAKYLGDKRSKSELFGYKEDCAKPFLEIIQKYWNEFDRQTHLSLSSLLKIHWLSQEIKKHEFQLLRDYIKSLRIE